MNKSELPLVNLSFTYNYICWFRLIPSIWELILFVKFSMSCVKIFVRLSVLRITKAGFIKNYRDNLREEKKRKA
jgi:hypothetical protein